MTESLIQSLWLYHSTPFLLSKTHTNSILNYNFFLACGTVSSTFWPIIQNYEKNIDFFIVPNEKYQWNQYIQAKKIKSNQIIISLTLIKLFKDHLPVIHQ